MGTTNVSDEFKKMTDASVSRLLESYKILLKKACIGSTMQPQDDLLIMTAASNIASHSHFLLDQVNELRMQLLLLNRDTVDVGEKESISVNVQDKSS